MIAKIKCSKSLSEGIETATSNQLVQKYRNHLRDQKGTEISDIEAHVLSAWFRDKVRVKVCASIKVNLSEMNEFIKQRRTE